MFLALIHLRIVSVPSSFRRSTPTVHKRGLLSRSLRHFSAESKREQEVSYRCELEQKSLHFLAYTWSVRFTARSGNVKLKFLRRRNVLGHRPMVKWVLGFGAMERADHNEDDPSLLGRPDEAGRVGFASPQTFDIVEDRQRGRRAE